MYVGASMWCVLRLCLHVLLSFDTYVACHVSVDTSEMAKATTGMLRARQNVEMAPQIQGAPINVALLQESSNFGRFLFRGRRQWPQAK